MKINVRPSVLLVTFLTCVGVTSSYADVETWDSIAAIVNDDVVLVSEIQDRYSNYLNQAEAQEIDPSALPPKDVILNQIIERLIMESIQMQEAELRGIVVSDEDLAQGIERYAGSINVTPEYFREELERQGVNFREFREDMRRQLLLNQVQQKIVQQRIFISMQDIREFRNSPVFQEIASEEYRIGHILLTISDSNNNRVVSNAKRQAEEIVRELRAGANFASMAVQHSSSNTALEGGDLGWRKADQVPSLFSDVIQNLGVGETADPIENPIGIHIVQLLEKRGASTEKRMSTNLRHILIQPSTILPEEEALELAQDLRRRIMEGEPFAELAIEYSDDPGTALAGGELGWNSATNFVPEFAEVLDNTEIMEVSGVFKTEFGYHILEVLDRKEEDLTEDALNNLAYQALFNQRFDETHQAWLKEIRDRAYVKILLEVR